MFESCIRVKNIMSKFGFPWFIAGGWAIDLFLNKETRIHDDIEIGIYREHQMKLFRYFGNCKKYYIDNKSRIGKHEKLEWNKNYLRLPIHELHIKYEDIELEVLLNEKDENSWIYRRNTEIKLDLKKAILLNVNRIPFLCPEIVSLYKTKDFREKDLNDISKVVVKMDESQRKWLIDNISDLKVSEQIRKYSIANS